MDDDSRESERTRNPHLWPTRELIGYHLRAKDEQFGYVDDLIVDDREWSIRQVMVSMRRVPRGKTVLLSPDRIEGINWSAMHVDVSLTGEEIRSQQSCRNRPIRGHRA
jgi:hypothetical protein